jgi:uncharacterized Zn-finger protein
MRRAKAAPRRKAKWELRQMARTPKTVAEPTPASAAPSFDAPEVVVVRSKRVACDGDGGALGHPRVWLEMGDANFVECLYCDRRFVLGADHEVDESELLAPGVYEGSHGH